MAFDVKEMVLMAVTGNPGTGTVTAGAAVTGYQALAAGDDANKFDVHIYSVDSNGNPTGLWESQAGSTWTNSSTSLTRSAANVSDGSSGPGVLVNFSSGTQRVSVENPAHRIRFLPSNVMECRITAQQSVPVPVADQTAVTSIYLEPYKGFRISLPWGGFVNLYKMTTTYQLRLTDATQTGTTANGTKVISGLTDTSQLVRGMKVTGTNVGAAAVISTIDSATQVTVSVNSTGSASNTMTFKLPANTAYDVFAVATGPTTFRIQFGNAWTTSSGASSARADAVATTGSPDFSLVNTNNINAADSNGITAQTGKYLGTILTTGTDGQTEDSGFPAAGTACHRYVWNYYNRVIRPMTWQDSTASWTYATAAFRQANANASAALNAVIGVAEDAVVLTHSSEMNSASNVTAFVSIGRDSTTAALAGTKGGTMTVAANGYDSATCHANDNAYVAGGHSWNALEYANGATVTFQNILIASTQPNGMTGFVMG